MTNWNFSIEFDYTVDGFQTDQRQTIFHDHVTNKELGETLKLWKTHIKKVSDKSDLMITLSIYDDQNYSNQKSLQRYYLRKWMVDGTYEMENRPYTGYDYSNIHKLNFVRRADMLTHVVKDIEKLVRYWMSDIPEEESRYTMANFR